ncbi:MAG: beta-galactosidase [Anaerolineales bacterium]|nr:beta-galactosidase [Anaerolineales bacterium]
MDTKTASKASSKIYIGSAYYPEQWPEDTWKEDIRLMAAAGFNVVRMGEFAWSTFEPDAGEYAFDWLERAVDQMAAAGIESVLSTPTAGPPAWLVGQFPDMLAVDENGRRAQIGKRCHYCVNSPDFHEAMRRLVRKLAERFGANPHVIGWQLDNEYNRYCYCPRCQALFHDYLAQRYGTIDELNRRWTTAYWSQTYDDWEQIPLPIGLHNPGLMLEFRHFVTQSYRRFQRLQIDELRPRLRQGVWITHNFMDWHDGYDHYKMTEDLDMVSWDWYVGMGNFDYQTWGAAHDLVRGYKRQNFWLMETQPGNVNWKPVNSVLNKGEARTMAWHAVGHGADAVLYWQWRAPLNGQEQYHGTLLNQAGQPRPFYAEAQELAGDFSSVSSLLARTKLLADVAILNCYDSRWSILGQPHHKDFDYVAHLRHYYHPLAGQNIPVDILSADVSLEGYKMVIAPALLILNDQRVAQLKAFVQNGGHLVLTLRSGMKDEYNALLPSYQPGGLAELTGAVVDEYYALLTPVPVEGAGWKGESRLWAERLKVVDREGTQILATYGTSNGWLDGQPAITRRNYGKGCVTFVGAYLDDANQQSLLQQIATEAGVRPVLEIPAGVEACRRVDEKGGEIFILINHTRTEQWIQLPWRAQEHLQGRAIGNEFGLAPYGIAVVTGV